MTEFRIRIIREISILRTDDIFEACKLALHSDERQYPEKVRIECEQVDREIGE